MNEAALNFSTEKPAGTDLNRPEESKATPGVSIDGRAIVVTGKYFKLAEVHDEEWLEDEPVKDPEAFVRRLKEAGVKADIFAFRQKIPDVQPKYPYYYEWDNAAVTPTDNFEVWWEKRLTQESRKNARRAKKRGVEVKDVEFDDELARAIHRLFNEIEIKQGIPFAHRGKDFPTVKKEVSTMLERSRFIGAYYEGNLIGYIKLVFRGDIASILNIISDDKHYDKRPIYALVTRAVEICAEAGVRYLTYGRFVYGNKTKSSLAEFKRRIGFEEMRFPRYFIPLTAKGRWVLRLRLHRGALGLLPSGVIRVVVGARSFIYRSAIGLRDAMKGGAQVAKVKMKDQG